MEVGPGTVRFDENCVTRELDDGRTEIIRWEDLQEVRIVTTDEGPFCDDVYWVLTGDSSALVLPSESVGMDNLLARLQVLAGFDNQAVIDAMGSVDNAQFVCWLRKPANLSQ
jgi:hypothetical protein